MSGSQYIRADFSLRFWPSAGNLLVWASSPSAFSISLTAQIDTLVPADIKSCLQLFCCHWRLFDHLLPGGFGLTATDSLHFLPHLSNVAPGKFFNLEIVNKVFPQEHSESLLIFVTFCLIVQSNELFLCLWHVRKSRITAKFQVQLYNQVFFCTLLGLFKCIQTTNHDTILLSWLICIHFLQEMFKND